MHKRPSSTGSLLIHYVAPRWAPMALLFVALFATIAVRLWMPKVLGQFIDETLRGASYSFLTGLAAIYLALAVSNQVLSLGTNFLGQEVSWRATNDLRADLFDHVMHLDLKFHSRRTPGELIQRVDGDISSMSNFLSQFSVKVLGNLTLMVGVLVMLFREDWRVGLGLSVFALLALVTFQKSREMAVPARKEMSESLAQLLGYIEERLGGMADIRPNGAAAWVMHGLYLHNRRRYKTTEKAYIMGSVRWVIARGTFLAGNLLSLGVGAYLFMQGKVSLGTVYVIYNYTNLLLDPLEEISTQLQDFQTAAAGTARVLELFAMENEIEVGPTADASTAHRLPEGPLSLNLSDVSFKYDEGVQALQNVSLTLEPGRILGVVGRTGSGKSTLARMLLGFHRPSKGSVVLGGVDISRIPLKELRNRVGLVTQEVQIFKASVRDNVTMFNKTIPDDRVIQVMAEVGLGEWLGLQEDGLDTMIGPGGVGLSDGQSQLMAFARVLLRDPGLVVLDEASSRLDPATERLLEQAMLRLMSGRTAVVIAHRLSTLDKVDDIVVLESGQVVEFGDRKELAADPNSRFGRLLRHGMEELLA